MGVKNILKKHVSTLDTDKYASDDYDEVVENYSVLLQAFAARTERLNISLIQDAAKEIFNAPRATAVRFSTAMAGALRYCKDKGDKATSGVRLAEAVREVYNQFKSRKHTLEDVPKKTSPMTKQPKTQFSAPAEVSSQATQPQKQFSAPQGVSSQATVGLATKDAQVDDRRAVYALYGMSPPKVPKIAEATASLDCPVEIMSSQEVVSSQEPVDQKPLSGSAPLASSSAAPSRLEVISLYFPGGAPPI